MRAMVGFSIAILAINLLSSNAAMPESLTSCAVVPAVPSVPDNAKSLISTSEVDAAGVAIDMTGVIQQALDQLKVGEWLVFEPGVYRITKALNVGNPGVTLYGRGTTLFSDSATEGGITVRADNVSIYGFTLDQASTQRQSTPWSGGIAVYAETDHQMRRIRGTIIQRNIVRNAAAGGIFVSAADNFIVAENTVWRSLADGIHLTGGSSNGRIIANKVSETGDDMIAVVSYAGAVSERSAAERYKDWSARLEKLDRNIYIGGNRVGGQYWGRGISVVGGSQITIENNYISRTPFAAAVYLERETSYRTFGLDDVLVQANHIAETQTAAPSFVRGDSPRVLTGHGAIEIGSMQDEDELADPKLRAAFSIRNVAIVDNTIHHSRFAGIRVGVGTPETVSNVVIRGNTLSNVGATAVVDTHPGLVMASLRCAHNTLNGTAWPARCAPDITSGADTVAVTGANLECSQGPHRHAQSSRRPQKKNDR